MTKSTIVKWALAALLAAPATTLLAKTPVKKTLAHTKHHKLHHLKSKHTALSTRKHGKSLHAAKTSSHPLVNITTMPPTIDNIHT